MRVLTAAILVVLVLVVTLVGLNWGAMTAPVGLSVGPTTLEVPLGLTLLVLMSLLVALVAGYAVYLQGSALMEARRLSKEMLASRDLADKAEASRFTELRLFLEQLEARQRTVIEQTGNSLAASVGELEDKVERALGAPRV